MTTPGLQFRDRREAGRVLASELRNYAGRDDLIVLGLPRGGLPVAYEVAHALDAPLDVFVVRKVGVPGFEELAMGAVASGGVRVVNERVLAEIIDSDEALERGCEIALREIERREAEYRGGRPMPNLRGKTVILVDDGLATGATMRAAVMALRKHEIGKCVIAVPVAASDTCADLRGEVDELVCAITPPDFRAVGQFYGDFSQTTDEEVRDLLDRAAEERA